MQVILKAQGSFQTLGSTAGRLTKIIRVGITLQPPQLQKIPDGISVVLSLVFYSWKLI